MEILWVVVAVAIVLFSQVGHALPIQQREPDFIGPPRNVREAPLALYETKPLPEQEGEPQPRLEDSSERLKKDADVHYKSHASHKELREKVSQYICETADCTEIAGIDGHIRVKNLVKGKPIRLYPGPNIPKSANKTRDTRSIRRKRIFSLVRKDVSWSQSAESARIPNYSDFYLGHDNSDETMQVRTAMATKRARERRSPSKAELEMFKFQENNDNTSPRSTGKVAPVMLKDNFPEYVDMEPSKRRTNPPKKFFIGKKTHTSSPSTKPVLSTEKESERSVRLANEEKYNQAAGQKMSRSGEQESENKPTNPALQSLLLFTSKEVYSKNFVTL